MSSVPQTGVRHSTFESICLSRSSQSIASGFLRFWDILNFKKDMEFVGITVLFLDEKVSSIVKVDRFEVARLFDNLQVIANTNLELPDVVGQIRSVQGSDLTKETTRVVIRLLIDPKCLSSASPVPQTGVHHSTFESLCLGRSSQSIASGFLRFWDILNFKKDREFVGITVLFLNEKIRLFDNLQVITNTNLELPDVVGQIRSVQGSDLTKETTRVVIRLLIDP
ncbi:hypothetical protein DY000_02001248 [Brassica cretica]|uniref:Uncharacterized protein n=1 Tax=Brassica cretica TaxID=69181 RepID=A0ABQ7C4H4_BRACR|nr:hypothetical protein DY000_02001248 [Brassica cretica]